MKKSLIILIILIICGFCFYQYYWKPKYDIEPLEDKYTAPASAYELPLINIKNESKEIIEKDIKINKDIPEIKILSNKTSAEISSSYIARFVEDEENKFMKKVDDDMLKSTQPQNIINSFSLSTKIITNTPKLFTLRFDESTLTKRSSKPENLIRYMMFNVETGQALTYDNLFKDKEGANKAINEFLTHRGFSIEESIRSLKTNHKYVLSQDGLSIIADTQNDENILESKEIIIPFENISEYVDDNIKNEITSNKEYIRMSEPE